MPPVAATSKCTRLLNLHMLYSACSASSTTAWPEAASRSRDRNGTCVDQHNTMAGACVSCACNVR